jgi:HK97 family phage prohead protease
MPKKKIKRRIKPTIEVRSGKTEIRSYKSAALSVRKADDGSLQLKGTAIVFNIPSQDMNGFTEIVRYEAVQKALTRNDDIYLLWQHDSKMPLARTTTGSLRLTLTPTGLDFVATLPDSPLGQNVYQSIADRTVDSVSFGFYANPEGGDSWSKDDEGNIVRELLDIYILEISPVTWPAYEAPHVDVRSAPADIRAKLKRDIDDDDDEEDNPDDLDCDGVDVDDPECDEDRSEDDDEKCDPDSPDYDPDADCDDEERSRATARANAELLLYRLAI